MAIDGAAVINNSEIVSALNSIPAFSNLIRIGQAVGIVLIVYLAFLIFKGILGFRQHKKISKLVADVEKIDKKLDKLLKKN